MSAHIQSSFHEDDFFRKMSKFNDSSPYFIAALYVTENGNLRVWEEKIKSRVPPLFTDSGVRDRWFTLSQYTKRTCENSPRGNGPRARATPTMSLFLRKTLKYLFLIFCGVRREHGVTFAITSYRASTFYTEFCRQKWW